MNKSQVGIFLAASVAAALLTGCSGSTTPINELENGEYTGTAAPETDGSYGIIKFKVDNGQVKDVSFLMYDADGTVHDENYGLGADGTPHDEAFYQRAQNAIAAEHSYVTQLEETGNQNKVEVIAGASISHRQFLGAIRDAVRKAQR